MHIKKILEDKRLSCKAKGVASIINQLKVEPSVRELMYYVKDGEFAVKAALAELAQYDYLSFRASSNNQSIDEPKERSRYKRDEHGNWVNISFVGRKIDE